MDAENRALRWFDELSEEDLRFVRNFLLASGSLKAMAEQYDVSYPTIRLRLDRLIARLRVAANGAEGDPFRRNLRAMVEGGDLSLSSARRILHTYQSIHQQGDRHE